MAHVEAGLRSFNRNMPEEINRVLTDHVSNFLFCPTELAVFNLANEGIGTQSSSVYKLISSSAQNRAGGQSRLKQNVQKHEKTSSNPNRLTRLTAMSYELPPKVALVGDVMLDAVLHYKKFASQPQFELPERFILATIHRAENTDNLDRLQSIFNGVDKISREIPIIIPLHPRTWKIIQKLNLQISNPPIYIIEPVGYLEMIHLLENCSAVMTDSGGLQKEAFFFKKPCITLRDETEWVELVEHGFNRIAGADGKTIYASYKKSVAAKYDFSQNLYGDGRAGEKIVDFLVKHL